jgi:predicted nucleotidyltransferase
LVDAATVQASWSDRIDVEAPMLDNKDYEPFVILCCCVGSQAYGLANESSDTDRRGVFLPPARLHWSLDGAPERLMGENGQDQFWELRAFLLLALKATPTVLECLYTPLVELATPLARELLDMHSIFLSRLAYSSYKRYATGQAERLGNDVRKKGEPKWKSAMHLLRFLLAGTTVLREGRVPVRVEAHRDRLLAVRNGEVTWKEYQRWRQELMADFEKAGRETTLPDLPDRERAEAFLLRARRSMVE